MFETRSAHDEPREGLQVEQGRDDFRTSVASVAIVLSSAFYWAWFDSSVFRPTLFMSFEGSARFYSVFFIVQMSSSAVSLLVFRKRLGRRSRRFDIAFAGAALAGGAGTMLGAGLSSMPLVALGAVFMGCSCSYLLLAWASVFSWKGAKTASLFISASVAVGVFLDILIIGLAPLFAAVFTMLLPALSVAGLQFVRFLLEGMDTTRSGRSLSLETIFSESKHLFFGLSLSLVAAFFIFGFSFGAMQFRVAFSPTALYPFSSDALLASRGLASLAIFLATYFFPRRMYTVFRIGILVGIAGFIAVPFASALSDSMLVMGFAVAIGYATFDIITWTILAELSYATNEPAARSFAPGRFVVHASIVVGFVASMILLSLPLPLPFSIDESLSTTIGYFLVVAEMLLLGDNSAMWMLIRANTTTKDLSEDGADSQLDGLSAFESSESLAQIAESHGLTERETEILRYLLAGRSRPRIAQILCISENTVSSHVQHVYRKLGVHDRQELLDLLL